MERRVVLGVEAEILDVELNFRGGKKVFSVTRPTKSGSKYADKDGEVPCVISLVWVFQLTSSWRVSEECRTAYPLRFAYSSSFAENTDHDMRNTL